MKGRGEEQSQVVRLPHCWNARDTFQAGVVYYQGYGSYRTRFSLDPALKGDGALRLRSGGFYGIGEVWMNGRHVADVDGQYLGFDLDVTGFVDPDGTNLLGIRLDNKYHSCVLPGIRNPDFLLHGGLAGRVWLERLPTTGISDVRIETHPSERGADVAIEHECRGLPEGATVEWSVCGEQQGDFNSTLVKATASGDRSMRFRTKIHVKSARLWSCDDPYLYTAVGKVVGVGAGIPETKTRFGIRMCEFRPHEGFFLNGARTFLRGCNRHESMPGFGNALHVDTHREDAELIKRHGMNFVRLSHYPQSPEFLDACDELGILVYAELASWKSVRAGRWLKSACRQVEGMVKRDRNHPSVILWGMGNEARSRKAYQVLGTLIRTLDPTRPTIYAENHIRRARREGTIGLVDVWGCNYELEVLDEGCEASRKKAVVVSECSNYPPAERGTLNEERAQLLILKSDIERIEKNTRTSGFAVWSFNDYPTMRKDRFIRWCGIFDSWRLPKMAAFYLRAKYSADPFVKIVGDWGRTTSVGGKRRLDIFTNMPRVVLRCGGRQVAELGPGPHVVHEMEFAPSAMEAVAGDVKDVLPACGEMVRLEVEGGKGNVPCGGLMPFIVRAVDVDGNTATGWNGYATVQVSGPGEFKSYRRDDVVRVTGGVGRGFVLRVAEKGEIDVVVGVADGVGAEKK